MPIPVDLSKLSDVVKNGVNIDNIDNIDTTSFVKKNKYAKDGSDFEDKINKVDKKIPDVGGLVKKQISILKLVK